MPAMCRPDRTYVVTGGLGGFGLALLQWLCEKGARSLVVTSKRGMRTGEQAAAVQRLRASYGAKVRAKPLNPWPSLQLLSGSDNAALLPLSELQTIS
jgi:NAD(P)-dependent dehydrogenase (short-subunit alcohol dehydrogenase family)